MSCGSLRNDVLRIVSYGLHRAGPGADEHDDHDEQWSQSDWAETAVGEPVVFQARADPASGLWNGPLSPGASISPPVVLDDPWWTVSLPGSSGRPLLAERVGHGLDIGEAFTLRPTAEGTWTSGVAFEGAIIVD